jgi:transcriptional regulator with XRE-family HTH domain
MTLPEPLGQRIRRFREAKRPKMRQTDLSAKMQAQGHDTMTRERITEIESGKRDVSAEEVVSFARVLGVAITELLGVPDRASE